MQNLLNPQTDIWITRTDATDAGAHDFNYTVEKNDIKNRNGRSLIICKKDGQ